MFRSRCALFGLAVLILLGSLATPALAAKVASWSEVAGDTYNILRHAGDTYEAGDAEKAKKLVNDAYFGPLEQQGMEAAIRLTVSAERVYEFEERFRELKKLMPQGVEPAEIDSIIEDLGGMLRQEAAAMDGARTSSPYAALFNSFVIILREGLEAILVVGALTAYMVSPATKTKYVSSTTASCLR